MSERVITIKGKDVEVSDGYHTFDQLYTHRIVLFLALMKSHPQGSWKSKKHSDGSMYEGYFLAGMDLPTGQISYHIPLEQFWDTIPEIQEIETAPEWDGYTSDDVVLRLSKWVGL